MNHSAELDQIIPALLAFHQGMPTVRKSKTAEVEMKNGGRYSYTYADLGEIVDAAEPILQANGLVVTQLPSGAGLSTMVAHSSGQWIEDTMDLVLAGVTPQGQGSGITYGRRYAYCAALGIVAEDDDDAQAAMPAQQVQQQRPTPTQRPQAAPPQNAPRSGGNGDRKPYDWVNGGTPPAHDPNGKAMSDGMGRRLFAVSRANNVDKDRAIEAVWGPGWGEANLTQPMAIYLCNAIEDGWRPENPAATPPGYEPEPVGYPPGEEPF